MKQSFVGLLALLAIGFAFFNFDSGSTAQATSPEPSRSFASQNPATPQEKGDSDGPVVIEDSMHEFMEYVFQPTYRRLKVTMATEPENNSGWKAMKSDALILAESCNLLFPRTPEKDGDDWKKFSADSRTHGADLYQAARAKDFDKATGAYKMMLNSCNACHRQFENGKHILKP
ncbi:MAG: hypothetical protein ABJZ55_24365 [Fuerstiella sp.]